VPSYHLVQLNIAKMKYPIDSAEMVEFVDNLENINALAEDSPGFVWRLQTDDGDATGIDFFGSDVLINMSIWKDVETLHNFVYKTAHTKIMSRRKEWFHRVEAAYTVLWWVPEGVIPLLDEAKLKLEKLRGEGPSPEAFPIKQAYAVPEN
jgi:hypothetical protein